MKIFKDANGREWKIAVTIRTLKAVRDTVRTQAGVPVNLAQMVEFAPDGKLDTGLLDELARDPVLLSETLWALVRDQAPEDFGIEDFLQACDGDVLCTAVDLLLEEVVDFFPEAKRRMLRLILNPIMKLKEDANSKLDALAADPETAKRIAEEVRTFFASSTSLPASSGSTPEN